LYANSKNKELNELSLKEMQKFSDIIEKDVFENLSLEQTLASKNQIGGTSPERVFEALEHAKESLERE
jgi:argininosuccinate lyase